MNQDFADIHLTVTDSGAGRLIESDNSILQTVELIRIFTDKAFSPSVASDKLADYYYSLIKAKHNQFTNLTKTGNLTDYYINHIYGYCHLIELTNSSYRLLTPTWIAGYKLKDSFTLQNYIITRSGSYYDDSSAYGKLLRSKLILL